MEQISNGIKGSTKVFGVIGDPVCHTMSPLIHNTMAAMLGSDLVYTAFHVKTDGLEEAVRGAYRLGISGLNVTVPHKKDVMKCLCSIDKTAEAVGAVNTLKYTEKGYVGYNTDMIGSEYALKTNDVKIEGQRVLVLGAGGASNALAAMAAKNGAEKIYIANRTVEKAEALSEHIKKYYRADLVPMSIKDINKIDNCGIILNGTTLGFGENKDKTPVEDAEFFKKAGVKAVFDAIYSPWETRLLKDAAESGVKTVNGFDMLIYQAAAAREIWYEESLSEEFLGRLREQLTQYYLGEINK